MKLQKTETKKVDRHFEIKELNRVINAKHVNLAKYNDKINNFYEKLLKFVTILDFKRILNLYLMSVLLISIFFAEIFVLILNRWFLLTMKW